MPRILATADIIRSCVVDVVCLLKLKLAGHGDTVCNAQRACRKTWMYLFVQGFFVSRKAL